MSTADLATPHAASAPRWRAGLVNVARHEGRVWWSTRRWWLQLVLWTGLLGGMFQGFLWIADQANDSALQLEEPAVGVAEVFPQYLGLAVLLSTIGVVVLTQGVMLDERREGTLEWVLSKPVSRAAIVLAKFVAHAVPVLLVVVAGPWAVLYLLLSRATGGWWPLGDFLVVVGLVALVLLSIFALTLLLGTFTTSRAAVVGIPIASGMFYDGLHVLVRDLAGRLPFPWELTGMATGVAAGEPLVSIVPVVATVAWILAALAATIWRFRREQVS